MNLYRSWRGAILFCGVSILNFFSGLFCLSIAHAEEAERSALKLPSASEEGSRHTSHLSDLFERLLYGARQHALPLLRGAQEEAFAKAQKKGADVSILGNPYLDLQMDRGSFTKDIQVMGYLYTPIDLFGQRGARMAEADALLSFKEKQTRSLELFLSEEILYAIGKCSVSLEKIRLAEEGLHLSETELHYFQERKSMRDATAYDVVLAEGEKSVWTQWLFEAKAEWIAYQTALSALVGEQFDVQKEVNTIDPEGDLTSLVHSLGEQLGKDLENTPGLKENQAETLYWEKAKEKASAEARMPVQLTLIAGRGDPGDFRLGGGVAMSFPLFRTNQGELAKADAAMQTSAQMRASLLRKVRVERQGTWEQLRLLEDALRVQSSDKGTLALTKQAAQLAFEGYKAGKVDLIQVFLARREIQKAESRRLELLQNVWRTAATLLRLEGGFSK